MPILYSNHKVNCDNYTLPLPQQRVNNIKHLRIYIDHTLKCDVHINHIDNEVKTITFQFKQLKSGVSLKIFTLIYEVSMESTVLHVNPPPLRIAQK